MILVPKYLIIRLKTFTVEISFSRFSSSQKSVVYRIPLIDSFELRLVLKNLKIQNPRVFKIMIPKDVTFIFNFLFNIQTLGFSQSCYHQSRLGKSNVYNLTHETVIRLMIIWSSSFDLISITLQFRSLPTLTVRRSLFQ